MKRKCTTLVLAAALLLSLNVPAFASDCRPSRGDCPTDALVWQLLVRCGGCACPNTARGDWNELLRQWLAQQEPPVQPPAQQEAPAQQEQPAQQEPPAQPQTGADSAVRAYETEVVRLVNAERAKYGLAALTEDETLSTVARAKSQDMHDRGYFDHNSPTYGTPFQMMKSFGVSYRTAGENIAMGYRTPEAVVNAWMNSEGHRANILNASYTRIGVGYVADGNYWTQHFIG